MRFILLCCALVACTKQNPEACCVDEADCASINLPVGTTCDDGKLCRGHRCVEQSCNGTGDCDATAPYCVMTDEGRCGESCTSDMQCPGFSQMDTQKFCVGGGCVECRSGSDCPIAAPLCSSEGRCVSCVAHTDCASGVCANGSCASEDQIAYVATNGNPASDCTKVSPCTTVDRALLVGPARAYILIDAGTYTSTGAIALTGTRWLIGRGASRPVFTRSTDGQIFVANGSVDAKLEHIEVFGAHGTTNPNEGIGVMCGPSAGAPKVELVDVVARMNEYAGFDGRGCTFKATASTFLSNGFGIHLTDGGGAIDRCNISQNNQSGITLDEGLFVVSNSLITRNQYRGIDVFSTGAGNRIEFNTIVDNNLLLDNTGAGVFCSFQNTVGTMASNIIARNRFAQTMGMNCVYPASIIVDTDITPLKFKSPDAAPFDYHIQAGSLAVDAATTTTIKVDVDGEARPFGGGTDVGADELH